MVPKGYKTNINIHNQKIGLERREEMVEIIADKGTYLPKGISEEDMDSSFLDFLNLDKRMSLVIDGEKVPVIFLTIQRWIEFSKTWQFSDKYKDISLPFITVVRKPDIQQGQNQAGLWNIPMDQTYTYCKVPTWDGVRKGVDLYKIPQPTSVDMSYEVRIFTNRMKDLNKLNGKIQRAFQSKQCYINVKGHPMPLHLENIGDESNIDDFENRRFYIQLFEIKLLGYILDEEDFEVIPTINRTMITTEVSEKKFNKDVVFTPISNTKTTTFNFVFKPNASPLFTFVSQYDLSFVQITNISNISRIIIKINNIGVFDGIFITTPIVFSENDTIEIKVTKLASNLGEFTLIGNVI